jgi:hypothetical protein
MGIKVANNAFATLASGITSSATSITVASGQGARFPILGAGDYFYATLINTSNQLEIVKCTARSADVLTVVRAQEGTTARAYDVGDRIEIRITAATFEDATAIPDESITAQLIAPDAVTTAKILDGNVTDAKIAAMAASKLTGRVPDANAPLGSVIQVVQAVKTNAFAGSAGAQWADVPGLSATITPTSAANKILVLVDMKGAGLAGSGATTIRSRLVRNTTPIYFGDAAGVRPLGMGEFYISIDGAGLYYLAQLGGSFLDSPATTSPVTYKVQFGGDSNASVVYINRTQGDRNLTGMDVRSAASIILMEIAA